MCILSEKQKISSKTLVSILIPTYNRPLNVKSALQSAVEQTYDNIEIIICDNSDNENTKSLVCEYMNNFENIKYYKNNSNLGFVGNMRRCLEVANGEYINFLLDDDLFMPNKIEKMMDICLADPEVNLVSSPHLIIDEEGNIINQTGLNLENDWVGQGRDLANLSFKNMDNFIGAPTTVLFKKSSYVGQFGVYDSFDFLFCADWIMWYSILQIGKAAYLKEPLCYFRKHLKQQSQEILREGRCFSEYAKVGNILMSSNMFTSKVEYVNFVIHLLNLYVYKLQEIVTFRGEELDIPDDFAKLMYSILSKL